MELYGRCWYESAPVIPSLNSPLPSVHGVLAIIVYVAFGSNPVTVSGSPKLKGVHAALGVYGPAAGIS